MKLFRALIVGTALLVLYAASFLYLWRRTDRGAVIPSDSIVASAPEPRTPAFVPPPQTDLVASTPVATRKADARVTAAAPLPPAAVTEGDELPVVLGFIKKFDFFRDETSFEKVRRQVNEGIVSIPAGTRLEVTVIDTNVSTLESTQATFVLGGGAQRHFGMHDGLAMTSGDQVTLRSPPFRDLVQPIP